GAVDLTSGDRFRPCKVSKRERGCELRFPVLSRDRHERLAHGARLCIDRLDYLLLPRSQLELAPGMDAARDRQAFDKPDYPLRPCEALSLPCEIAAARLLGLLIYRTRAGTS